MGSDRRVRVLFAGPMLGKHTGRIPNPAEELVSRLDLSKYHCWLTSSHPNRYVRLFDILWTIFRLRKQVDLVSLQVYSGPSFIVEDLASRLAKSFGLKLVMVLHGGAMPEFMARYPRWSHRVLSRADRLVSPSSYLARTLKASGFEVTVIPNGMDVGCYPFRLRQGGLPSLVWLRAFHPVYQPEMAVEVVARLVRDFPKISMQMIGPTYGESYLLRTRSLIARLGLEDHIQIVGYVPKAELPAYLGGAEIFINTTSYESFGITVMEAAACGLPIVTTDVGELSFLWCNGLNALTVGVSDAAGMAEAVKRIIKESGLALQLSASARRTAEQFDWGNVLPLWDTLFHEVLG